MAQECPLCGKTIADDTAERCPRCGEPLAAGVRRAPESPGALVFPQRTGGSLRDELDASRRREFEMGGRGDVFLLPPSWEEIFAKRPFDIPLYTAMADWACIGVYFSSAMMSRPEALDEILVLERSFGLHCAVFHGSRYPVLRCNLAVPDNPRDPLILESPLDIRNGDVQDFCQAVLAEKRLCLILAHEARGAGSGRVTEFRAPGLAGILSRELKEAIDRLDPAADRADFNAGVREMESTFPSPGAGLDRSKIARLVFAGNP